MTLKELSELSSQMRDASRRLSMVCLPRQTEEVGGEAVKVSGGKAVKVSRSSIMGGNSFWAAFTDRKPGVSIQMETTVNGEKVLTARLPPGATLEDAAEMAENMLKLWGIELVDE